MNYVVFYVIVAMLTCAYIFKNEPVKEGYSPEMTVLWMLVSILLGIFWPLGWILILFTPLLERKK